MLPNLRLIRVSKAEIDLLEHWKEGVSLVSAAGKSIDDLCLDVAVHRWKLGLLHKRDGNKLMQLQAPPYRSAISRYYYSMYHCFRAAAFISHRGDNHESHSNLPKHLPVDFPSVAFWQNELKMARLTRNDADYDPYPRTNAPWQNKAKAIQLNAINAVLETRNYLRSKGCTGI